VPILVSILRAASLAVLTCIAGSQDPAALAAIAAAPEQPMHDVERLKTLPLFEVIRWSTGRHVGMLTHRPHQADPRFDGATPLAAVDKLAPELRSLTWLMVLPHGWMLPDQGSDLYDFFCFQSGDLAPQVRDVLTEAAFAEQSQVLSEAIALFGPSYPIEHDKRETCFSDALERKLSALNKKFGSRSDYEAAVEAYVRRNPKPLQWAQDARPRVTENARLMWLMEQLYQHLDAGSAAFLSESKLSALPKAYQQLVYLGLFWGEVFNGGIEQFFFNSNGEIAPEVAQTLPEVGLGREAEVVKQCMDLFPSPYPVDRNRRRDLMLRNGKAIDKKLREMSDLVDSVVIRRAMIDLARCEGVLPQ
jgi:hypothetical protein